MVIQISPHVLYDRCEDVASSANFSSKSRGDDFDGGITWPIESRDDDDNNRTERTHDVKDVRIPDDPTEEEIELIRTPAPADIPSAARDDSPDLSPIEMLDKSFQELVQRVSTRSMGSVTSARDEAPVLSPANSLDRSFQELVHNRHVVDEVSTGVCDEDDDGHAPRTPSPIEYLDRAFEELVNTMAMPTIIATGDEEGFFEPSIMEDDDDKGFHELLHDELEFLDGESLMKPSALPVAFETAIHEIDLIMMELKPILAEEPEEDDDSLVYSIAEDLGNLMEAEAALKEELQDLEMSYDQERKSCAPSCFCMPATPMFAFGQARKQGTAVDGIESSLKTYVDALSQDLEQFVNGLSDTLDDDERYPTDRCDDVSDNNSVADELSKLRDVEMMLALELSHVSTLDFTMVEDHDKAAPLATSTASCCSCEDLFPYMQKETSNLFQYQPNLTVPCGALPSDGMISSWPDAPEMCALVGDRDAEEGTSSLLSFFTAHGSNANEATLPDYRDNTFGSLADDDSIDSMEPLEADQHSPVPYDRAPFRTNVSDIESPREQTITWCPSVEDSPKANRGIPYLVGSSFESEASPEFDRRRAKPKQGRSDHGDAPFSLGGRFDSRKKTNNKTKKLRSRTRKHKRQGRAKPKKKPSENTSWMVSTARLLYQERRDFEASDTPVSLAGTEQRVAKFLYG